MTEKRDRHNKRVDRFGPFAVFIVIVVLGVSLIIGAVTLIQVHEAVTRHSQTIAQLKTLEQQSLTIQQGLKSGHVQVTRELAQLQYLVNYVLTIQKSSGKPNPDVAYIEQILVSECQATPGCIVPRAP